MAASQSKSLPAEQQRRALNFVVNNAFRDEAFGLSPELLVAMGLISGKMFQVYDGKKPHGRFTIESWALRHRLSPVL